MKLFRRSKPAPRPARVEPTITKPRAWSMPRSVVDRLKEQGADTYALDSLQSGQPAAFRGYKPLPGVVPDGMALDATLGSEQLYSYTAAWQTANLSFPGFPLLAELAQRPEYRHISDTIAREMTRKWGELRARGDDDKSDKIERLTELLSHHEIQAKFRQSATNDGLFGRGHIYVDVDGAWRDPALLSAKLGHRGVRKGSGLRFTCVEPIWTYPNNYDSQNPLSDRFYRPQTWFVMGQNVHESRLLTFVGRPLPDMLKPTYGFAGLSLTQMAIPYVQNWLRTRQSVSDLLHSFSIMVLATDMGQAVQTGTSDDLFSRVDAFNLFRDNRGSMVIDKDSEALTNVSAPIAGLDKLQAQAQEQMASVSGIPLVKLLGITPSGLNASSDGEIRVFYDTMHAAQEALFGPRIREVLDYLQLAEFGEIDPDLIWEWAPLWQLDEAGQAAWQKTLADRDLEYVEAGVLSPEDVRKRVADDPDSGYNNIDVDDLPEAPTGAGGEINDPETNRVDKQAEAQGGVTSGV